MDQGFCSVMGKGSLRETKVHWREQKGLPVRSTEANTLEGKRSAHMENHYVWWSQGTALTVDTNCFIRDSEIRWDSPSMAGP